MDRLALGRSVLGGLFLLLLSGSSANASTVIPASTCQAPNTPYMITASGDYVLGGDITCNDSSAIIVNADNVTIRLKGFSIRCWDATGYKMSCQGSFYTGSDNGQHIKDCGVWTNGHSNVKIQGPGLIQDFGVGILMDGGGIMSCGSQTASTPTSTSVSNVMVMKVNVTGPDGRSDISDPFAGPRPRSFGIIAVNFIETASTCPNWDSDDGHTHGVDVFGNAVENYTEGISLYNASRVHVHKNFVHDNNDAGDSTTPAPVCTTIAGVTTCVVTPVTTFESHGIVVCANGTGNQDAGACTPGISFRNKIELNLVVDNGQNSCTRDGSNSNCSSTGTTGHQNESGGQNIDGGISLIGNAMKNVVHHNTVTGNNGDGISLRNGADNNVIIDNASQYNTSTDAPYNPNGTPTMPHFWDITFRDAGLYNKFNSNNDCLTQSPNVPAGVCKPGENTTWFTTP